jgi:hypothetical protein
MAVEFHSSVPEVAVSWKVQTWAGFWLKKRIGLRKRHHPNRNFCETISTDSVETFRWVFCLKIIYIEKHLDLP